MSKTFNPLKEVKMNIGMITTESVGYGVAGKIAGSMNIRVTVASSEE